MYYVVQLVREATIKNDTYQREEFLPWFHVYAPNEKALYEKIDILLECMPGVVVEYAHEAPDTYDLEPVKVHA
jgi:hypothetical protein|tara:strand:+ start:387 stop:605 length:219 start_codon:yes stop_codon:yes gene_type:complete